MAFAVIGEVDANTTESNRILRLIRKWLHAGVIEEGVWSSSDAGTPQGSGIAPPTEVQNFLLSVVASIPRKKGEVDSVDDSNLFFLDHDTVDKRAQDLPLYGPVCLLQVVADRGCEVVQAGECLSKCCLLA